MLAAAPEAATRGRDLGIPFDFGRPGPNNAITDVRGVEVGHVTLVEGEAVRTGVTAVLPRGKGDDAMRPCFSGRLLAERKRGDDGHGVDRGVGDARGPGPHHQHQLASAWCATRWWRTPPAKWQKFGDPWSLPVVAETWDGRLNDIGGMHVKPQHAVAAIEAATPGPVAEGNVGGGTGMVAFEYKGGIGTSSRVLSEADGGYTVGVLVQANFGLRHQLRIAGLPVGQELRDNLQYSKAETGSIIIVVATDAPLLPHQVKRLARRAALGLARTGSVAGNGSGDLFIAFSTASTGEGEGAGGGLDAAQRHGGTAVRGHGGRHRGGDHQRAGGGADDDGKDGRTVHAIPHEKLREILERHRRLAK